MFKKQLIQRISKAKDIKFYAILAAVVIAAIFMINEASNESALASIDPATMMSNDSAKQMQMMGIMGGEAMNWTGSVPVGPIMNGIIGVIKSNTNTTLSDAISSVESELGNNSMVFAGTLAPFNGYLVYMLLAVDDSNNISGAIVDAGDGEVLASKPIDLSGKHHDGKGMMGPGSGMMGPGM